MIGKLVGHYRVLELIGSGGMGEVYRAHDEKLDRDVALKIIRQSSGDKPDHLRRFQQEARAAASLNHPNILAIYDVGIAGKDSYIASELLQGKTLRVRLDEGPIPIAQATDYALQIAHGLTAAHERHIIHRDLKPENLFLNDDGHVKILDFGVAKLQASPEENRPVESLTTVTKMGTVIGTYAYMSPEQLRAMPVDYRSDIFSLGAVLYEMLSGHRAFRGETQVDTITAVLREEPPVANLEQAAIPTGYQEIVKHCLEKEPDNRFQSVRDLGFALQTLAVDATQRVSFSKPRSGLAVKLPWAIIALLALATAVLSIKQLQEVQLQAPGYRRLTFESGTVDGARFAAAGQSIVYSASWNNQPTQLFSTVGSSYLTQPLNLKNATLLAVSPNNDLAVVVNGTHSGQLETINGTLARAPLAGGSPHEILSDVRWADFNAQGEMAVVHYAEGHCRLEFPLGKVLYQTGGWISNIRFSPDGRQIAFMEHPALWDDRGTVSVVDMSGHARVLTKEWESERGLAWRDGKEIWFTAVEEGNRLNLMAVDLSGKLRTILDLPTGLDLEDIAADGRVLASLTSKRLAMAAAVVGNKDRADVDLSWHDWNSPRDISSDGQTVLFEDSSEAAGPNYQVVIRKLDGTLPAQLGEGSSGGMSPDGKWAIATLPNHPTQLVLLPIGAGQSRTIQVSGLQNIHNALARFLPDGERIAVVGEEADRKARCYIVNAADGRAVAATPEGFLCGPSSPDGRSILGRGPNHAMVIYSLTGGPPRPLSALPSTFAPAQWSSDGNFLYGQHSGEFPSRVYRFNIATGKETVLEDLKPGVPAGVVMVGPVVVSRDGKEIAYGYNQTLSDLYIISGLK
ncbi:MAG TPA: protein kinase [Candidatus Solibacter sp.]|nr:protein kinase [Candidatus Solibacter sp.]